MIFNDDEDLYLSPEALSALNEFIIEKQDYELNEGSGAVPIKEDWQLSQFWYDEVTTETLVKEVKANIEQDYQSVLCISSPTLHIGLLENEVTSTLLEFDDRFGKYEGFVHYDYKAPLNIPVELHSKFDLVILDPPFLSEKCLKKTTETVRLLMKSTARIILCTGKVQETLAKSLLGVTLCSKFYPRHKSSLSNDFGCFVNYDTLTF